MPGLQRCYSDRCLAKLPFCPYSLNQEDLLVCELADPVLPRLSAKGFAPLESVPFASGHFAVNTLRSRTIANRQAAIFLSSSVLMVNYNTLCVPSTRGKLACIHTGFSRFLNQPFTFQHYFDRKFLGYLK